MATTMKYTSSFVPFGVLSVTAGFYLHFRERRRCALEGCRMVSGKLTLLLTVAAIVVSAAVFFTIFPGLSPNLLIWAMSGHGAAASHTMHVPMDSPSRK